MSDEPAVLMWHKSNSCIQSECIEVAGRGNRILIRDSADSSGPILEFQHQEWCAFIRRITAP
jgi:hypothetical protein